jgi:hypothetical protein
MALTDNDLKALKSLMRVTIEETARDLELVTKEDVKHLPTKDEFYEQTGEILKRLDNLEVEKEVLAHHVSEHEDKISKIQSHLNLALD